MLKVPSDLEGLESVRLEHLASAKEQLAAVKDYSKEMIEQKSKIREKMLITN